MLSESMSEFEGCSLCGAGDVVRLPWTPEISSSVEGAFVAERFPGVSSGTSACGTVAA